MRSWRHWAVLLSYVIIAPLVGMKEPWIGVVVAVAATLWFFVFIKPSDDRAESGERMSDAKRNIESVRKRVPSDYDKALIFLIETSGCEMAVFHLKMDDSLFPLRGCFTAQVS